MRKLLQFVLYLTCSLSVSAKEHDLAVTQVSDNVFKHVSYAEIKPWGWVGANGLIVVQGEGAYIIDTPWSLKDTKALVKWIEGNQLKLKGAVVSHFHEDASGGLATLNELGITTYASSMTNELLHTQQKVTATNEIATDVFQLVKGTIEIYYPGAGHSQDNIVVWLPHHQVLFGGCFVKSLSNKNLGNIADASIADWPHSITKVMAKYPNIEIVVPGHGAPGSVELLKHTAHLASKVMQSKDIN